jgi:hypothetical protein
VRLGRVPRVLRAHSPMIGLCNLRIESTQSHNGEQARADRTHHAEAGGSHSPYPRRQNSSDFWVQSTIGVHQMPKSRSAAEKAPSMIW